MNLSTEEMEDTDDSKLKHTKYADTQFHVYWYTSRKLCHEFGLQTKNGNQKKKMIEDAKNGAMLKRTAVIKNLLTVLGNQWKIQIIVRQSTPSTPTSSFMYASKNRNPKMSRDAKDGAMLKRIAVSNNLPAHNTWKSMLFVA